MLTLVVWTIWLLLAGAHERVLRVDLLQVAILIVDIPARALAEHGLARHLVVVPTVISAVVGNCELLVHRDGRLVSVWGCRIKWTWKCQKVLLSGRGLTLVVGHLTRREVSLFVILLRESLLARIPGQAVNVVVATAIREWLFDFVGEITPVILLLVGL